MKDPHPEEHRQAMRLEGRGPNSSVCVIPAAMQRPYVASLGRDLRREGPVSAPQRVFAVRRARDDGAGFATSSVLILSRAALRRVSKEGEELRSPPGILRQAQDEGGG